MEAAPHNNAFAEMTHKISDSFRMYGIKSVTMDDLAHSLGISKKTLYQHFSDKKDVVRKVIDFQIRQQQDDMQQVINQKHWNAIDQLFQLSRVISSHLKMVNPSMIYDLKKHYLPIWEHILDFKRKTVYDIILKNSHQGIREGLYCQDQNYMIISRAYVNQLEHYTVENHNLQDFPPEEIFNTLVIYHIRGVSNSRGIAYLEKLMQKNKKHAIVKPLHE
ncbi:MAG: TetR/AcrR family transcriptional regulator [Bacteroidales bacterium]